MTSPDKATLLALADRIEKLTGPDREVDRDILRATSDKVVANTVGEGSPIRASELPDDRWYDAIWAQVPCFTSSLDAAMTLVPEGTTIIRFHLVPAVKGYDDTSPFWSVDIGTCVPDLVGGTGATKAAALTAASLRALAAGRE